MLFAGCAMSCVLAMTGAARAEAADGSDARRAAAVEEVVVTARRREENIQDVPAAVTALNSQALQQRASRPSRTSPGSRRVWSSPGAPVAPRALSSTFEARPRTTRC
jgi:outer membrane receptor protein involved in Fe transport